MERIIYCFCMALSRLPWWLMCALSSCLAWVLYTFHAYRYRVVMENLALAFPDKTEKERKAIARNFYRVLTDTAFGALKMLTASDAFLRRQVEFVGWQQLQQQVDAGQSVVLYIGHYGNWELVQTTVWAIPKEFVCAQIYRPMHNSLGHTVMDRLRNRFGALNLPQESAFRTLLRLKMEGKISITGFIADQRPNFTFKNWTRFLGLPTAYVAGGEEIGRRIGAAYYYLEVERIGRGRERLTLKPVEPGSDPTYPMTTGYLHMLEQTIRRDPAPWLWTHKRWAGQLDHKMEQ